MTTSRTFLTAILLLVSAATLPANAFATERDPGGVNVAKCFAWCGIHNKTAASLAKCDGACARYWRTSNGLSTAIKE